jgi:hypothetical protein
MGKCPLSLFVPARPRWSGEQTVSARIVVAQRHSDVEGKMPTRERSSETDRDGSGDGGEDAPRRKGDFQKRVQEEVEHSLQEHPDGSAPPLDRLTQDLDPNKEL